MRNSIYLILLLIFILLFFSCENNKRISVKTYQYHFLVTTGITTTIYNNGKSTNIKFHLESNRRALNLLFSLRPEILYPSSKRIYLVGTLYNEIKKVPEKSPEGQILAEGGELYQEFLLYHWYILCPFTEMKGDLDNRTYIERNELLYRDFGLSVMEQKLINLNDYYKKQGE